MKRWICPACLLLAVGMVLPDTFRIRLQPWIVCVPAAAWAILLLFGRSRFPALREDNSLLLGLIYGAVGASGSAAGVSLAISVAFSTVHRRHPYDNTAYAIILAISCLLLVALAFFDDCKFQMKPFWLRLVTAMTAFLPFLLLSAKLMDYFEGILSCYVS